MLDMIMPKHRDEDSSRIIGLEPLRSVPLFRDFDQAELSEVAQLVSTRRLGKHQTIFREGDPGQTFYLILSGSVAIYRNAPDGRETILSILKERDFFGEMSIFDTAVRAASVRTLTEVEVGVIERDDFLALIDRSPRIGRLLVIALSERLRAANKLISATTSQDIRSRLASLLLNLATNFGEPAPTGTRITLRLTNQEMANMIGTTRETVNRTLNRFWDERLIDMRTAHVVVVEFEKLKAMVP
jgi:CRP/FNR family transcriptional regulator